MRHSYCVYSHFYTKCGLIIKMRDGKQWQQGNEMRNNWDKTKEKLKETGQKRTMADWWLVSFAGFLLPQRLSSCSFSVSLCHHVFLLFYFFFSLRELHCPSIPSSLPGFSGKLSADLDSWWPPATPQTHTCTQTHAHIQPTHTSISSQACSLPCVQQPHTHTIVAICSKFLDLHQSSVHGHILINLYFGGISWKSFSNWFGIQSVSR